MNTKRRRERGREKGGRRKENGEEEGNEKENRVERRRRRRMRMRRSRRIYSSQDTQSLERIISIKSKALCPGIATRLAWNKVASLHKFAKNELFNETKYSNCKHLTFKPEVRAGY